MLAGWCRSGGAEAGLELALVQGLAAAALAISAVGLRGLVAASPALLAERVRASRPQPAES
jgi:hypothetical protein